ncbi:hypothetical protein G5I_07946 [Acromyrmex echinatior]|uniref:Uncharacterized protein n=1 Tax=Acromyrmex echinatior TaxID=103372 RepID=F4WQ10_ACREC|nr:hypothetical protein G5I_07946 [Acromyrmex echinatior]
MMHTRTDLIISFGGAQFHETFGTGLWHRAIPYEIGGACTMHWSEKKMKETREEKKGIPKRTIDRTRMKGCPTLFRNPSGVPSNVRSSSYRIPYLLSDESNSYYHHCHRRGPDHHTYTTYMYGSHGGAARRATHRPLSFSLSGGVIAVDPFSSGRIGRAEKSDSGFQAFDLHSLHGARVAIKKRMWRAVVVVTANSVLWNVWDA